MCLPYNSKLSSDSPMFLEHAACSALPDEKTLGATVRCLCVGLKIHLLFMLSNSSIIFCFTTLGLFLLFLQLFTKTTYSYTDMKTVDDFSNNCL